MVMGSCNTLSMTLACKRHVIPDVCTCNQPLRISTFGYHPCLSFTRISINQVWSSPLLPLQLTSRLVLFHNLSSCSDLEFRILSLCPHAWLYFCCRFPHLSLLTILTPPHFQLERLTSIQFIFTHHRLVPPFNRLSAAPTSHSVMVRCCTTISTEAEHRGRSSQLPSPTPPSLHASHAQDSTGAIVDHYQRLVLEVMQ